VEKVRQLCSRVAQRLTVPERVRFASSLAPAALDVLFEHPAFNSLSMPETPSDGRILDIKHATVYRGDTCVFDNLSFVLEADQHTAILGPNGAGKSTILKLLAGEVYAMPKDETSIRLFGEEQWNVWDVRKRWEWCRTICSTIIWRR
jgi:ABC-type molybdenum transport system ATPase subunit/photorepair protein PhrA